AEANFSARSLPIPTTCAPCPANNKAVLLISAPRLNTKAVSVESYFADNIELPTSGALPRDAVLAFSDLAGWALFSSSFHILEFTRNRRPSSTRTRRRDEDGIQDCTFAEAFS